MLIEKAHGRLHAVYYCAESNSSKARLLTAFGFGATLLPSEFFIKKHSWFEVEEQLVRKNFDRTLKSLTKVRSLDIRTSFEGLDLKVIEEFRFLKSLRLKVELVGALDLKGLVHLEMLYGDLPSMQRIIGLEELTKLKYVSVSQLRKTWFEKLPPSVERLFLRGSLDPTINLGNLPQLEYLGISNSRNLDFAQYEWVAHRIKRLDLTENTAVVNAEHLIKLTPNLSSLHYRGGGETYSHLCKALKGFAEVIRLD